MNTIHLLEGNIIICLYIIFSIVVPSSGLMGLHCEERNQWEVLITFWSENPLLASETQHPAWQKTKVRGSAESYRITFYQMLRSSVNPCHAMNGGQWNTQKSWFLIYMYRWNLVCLLEEWNMRKIVTSVLLYVWDSHCFEKIIIFIGILYWTWMQVY